MLADELHDHREGRSSSAAKKADAAFKIALARFSSAFSRLSRRTSADSSVRDPRPGAGVDLGLPHPLAHRLRRPDPEQLSDPAHRRPLRLVLAAISATIRTARSFSSGGYLLGVSPGMTPTFPRFGVSGHAGAVHSSVDRAGGADDARSRRFV